MSPARRRAGASGREALSTLRPDRRIKESRFITLGRYMALERSFRLVDTSSWLEITAKLLVVRVNSTQDCP